MAVDSDDEGAEFTNYCRGVIPHPNDFRTATNTAWSATAPVDPPKAISIRELMRHIIERHPV